MVVQQAVIQITMVVAEAVVAELMQLVQVANLQVQVIQEMEDQVELV